MIFALEYSSLSSGGTEKKVQNITSDIFDKTFKFISAGKSDPFVFKVSNDICIEILSFVRSD